MTDNHLLLYRIAELMLENEQHILPVDLLFDDPQIGDFVKSIQIDSPYQQMLQEGVLTESVLDEKLYISFTVEGYFHYVLGEVIFKQTVGNGAQPLKQIIEENKLNGAKQGVEQCLIKYATYNDLNRIVWLIDNLTDDLKYLINPLATSFILQESVNKPLEQNLLIPHKEIEKKLIWLLKNNRSNDFFVLDGAIDFLKLKSKNQLLGSICLIILKNLKFTHFSKKLIIKCLDYVEYKIAEKYLVKINLDKSNLDYSTIYLIAKFYINNSKFDLANNFLANIDSHTNFSLGFIKSQLSIYVGETLNGIKLALELFKSNEILQHKLSLANLIGQGYLNIRDIENAFKFHQIAVNSALNLFGKYSEEYSIYLNNFASVYYWKGDYLKSIELLKNVEIIRMKIFPNNDLRIANIQINIGETLRKMKDYKQALLYQNSALQITRVKLPFFSLQSSAIETNCGLIFQSLNDYKRAIYHHLRSLVHKKNIFSLSHPSFAESYFELGTCYIKENRYDFGIKLLYKGYEILPHPNFVLEIMYCYEKIKDFNSINDFLCNHIIELQLTEYKTNSAYKSLLKFYETQLALENISKNDEVNKILNNDL